MNRWPTKPLGELLKVQNGFAFKSEMFNEDGKGLPIIRIRDLERGFSETFYDGEHDPAFEVENGNFLIGMDGEFRCYRWQGGKALLNQRVCRLQNFSRDLNAGYVFYGINDHLSEIEDNTAFVTVKHLSSKQIASIEMSVPPLAEQERIVKLLNEADELRKLRAQADRRTSSLIPALFYEMFGDPEHTRFSVKPLIELVVEERPITYGILKPGPDVKGGIPYVRVLDIKQSRLHVEQLHKTTNEIANQYRRSMLRPGDILVTIRGTVGRTCIVPDELTGANITQDTARLGTIPSIEPVYVVEFLNTPWAQGWMNHHTQGQAVKGINLGDLKKLPVPVPPLPLQKKFAARVSEIRTVQAEQDASCRRLENLFQSMLHRAFMGEL